MIDTCPGPPYPPDTKAFLYFLRRQKYPAFRVASSDDSASFKSGGFDLLEKNGRPWSHPLFFVSKCYYIPLYEKGRWTCSRRLGRNLSTLFKRYSNSRGQLFYTLNDTFITDFSRYGRTLSSKELLPLVRVERRRTRDINPYTGA